MSEQSKNTVSKILDNSSKILEELQSQGKRKKDAWEKFSTVSTFLSTFVIASLGLYLTSTFNEQQGIRDHQNKTQQTRILEMQTIEKFIPHLTHDEKTKEIALLALTTLGNTELATQLAQLLPSKGSDAATDTIMRIAASPEQRPIQEPVKTVSKVEAEGWVYIGHFVDSETLWRTRYFEIDPNVDPESLVGKTLIVREETGSLNVRKGMPTPSGSFKPVVRALKPGSKATILKVSEWSSSGYIWAHITYTN